MSYPILYDIHEQAFTSNGFGILADAVSCTVTEERNGSYELEMEYPITGIHYSDITLERILLAKPNPVDQAQPFRIYDITRPMRGIVTVYARHICYDLADIPVSPFTAGSAAAAVAQLKNKAAVTNPFTFWTDKTTAADMAVTTPTSIWSLLGGSEGGILDVYGGEYKFDRFRVSLYGRRGADLGVSIRYGKNLTDLKQEENCANVYTGIYPYWTNSEGELAELPETVVEGPGTYPRVRIKAVDLSREFEERPTAAQLRKRAEQYIAANDVGVPKVSLDVSFVQLEQFGEYKQLALLERVAMGDTVSVSFPAMGVSAKARVVSTTYDVILERYKTVTIGDARSTLASTIVDQQKDTQQQIAEAKTFLQQAVDVATGLITGNRGGYVVLHSSTGGKEPDEILIMDTPDIKTATKVWRFNQAGLGFSSNGYNGPYGLAMTMNGAIVADFITVGQLAAALIKTGVIQNQSGTTIYDLDEGTIQMGATTGPHVRITDNMIRWYLGTSVYPKNGGPTGVFYSVDARSYIGANSESTYYGWVPQDPPFSSNFRGMRIQNVGNEAYFNTATVSCKDHLTATTVTCTNLEVTSSKDRVVDTPTYGLVGMAAMESPMPLFCDSGSGRIGADGVCYLFLNDRYRETVSESVTPQWHVTASAPVTVRKQGAAAVVEGQPGTTFDWLVLMPQRGFEGVYAPAPQLTREEYLNSRDYMGEAWIDDIEAQRQTVTDDLREIQRQRAWIGQQVPA